MNEEEKKINDLVTGARELNYDSIVAKISGKELSEDQKADYEAYKAQYKEATDRKQNN